MNNKITSWALFVLLSFIWGSSFILMKEGLLHLTAFQVASLRIVSSGFVLIPIAVKAFQKIPYKKWPIVFLSGSLGSLLPAYLFCMAEQGIDSSLAGTLNSLTPIFTIITGVLFFKTIPSVQKIIGILLAFSGCIVMYFSQSKLQVDQNAWFVFYVILATFFYGLNVNLVHHHLKEYASLEIVGLALFLNAIPALIVLCFSGYFSLDFHDNGVLVSIGFTVFLGILGTSIASILFYKLIKSAGAVFSSMVTYGIPFVAILWGFIYKEKIGSIQLFSLLIILSGVYVANKKRLS